MTPQPTTTKLEDKRGVLESALEMQPSEVKEIAFFWRIGWPKDKGVVMVPG